jgi:hypothetical protein
VGTNARGKARVLMVSGPAQTIAYKNASKNVNSYIVSVLEWTFPGVERKQAIQNRYYL